MMKTFFALLLLIVLATSIEMERRSLEQKTVVVKDVDVEAGVARAFSITGNPTIAEPNILTVAAAGFSVSEIEEGDSETDVAASLDLATFRMQNAAPSRDLGFYFGYLDAGAEYDFSSGIGGVDAALSELALFFYGFQVYEDRNGQPGLQYDANADMFNCASTGDHDCIRSDPGFAYEFQKITWEPISVLERNCSDDENAVVSESAGVACKVNTFSTMSTDGAVTFDMSIASQPVLLGDIDLDPDFTKIDVSFNYNWTGKDCDGCKLALTAYTGGKVTTGSFTVNNASSSLTFATGNTSAVLDWEKESSVQGTTALVYFSTLDYADLQNNACTGCGIATNLVNGLWELALGVLEAFGWRSTFIFFSWDEANPTTIYWDPRMGLEKTEEPVDILSEEPTDMTNDDDDSSATLFFISPFILIALLF